jgi:hypothetical protein
LGWYNRIKGEAMEEREELRKIYQELPEEKLIEMVLEDEKEYKRQPYEAYELLLEEAKKRGLEDKINQRRQAGINREDIRHEDSELVVIKRFRYRGDAGLAQGLLTDRGIESIVSADDVGGLRPEIAFGRGAVHLLVKKSDLERAKEALRVLEEPINEKE